MEWIGDLERGFATWVYPNRVLVALIGVAVVVAVAFLAWRGRWDRIARRRPARAAAVGAAFVAVALPLGWYLGSPLFITNTIDEPAPVVAGGVPTATPVLPAATASADPTPARVAERSGQFHGADDFHFGRGTARLIETAPGAFTVRLENFEVRNGPDLYVYLSSSADGYAAGAIELGRLKADRGNQNYAVKAGTNVSAVRSVVIWCKQFGVLFATAPLS
ncbi:MAG TPA: DM13 domain-containing protein [Candidatus Limnocylindrales bacterium]|nr:DM13 domain-containing protein [Candidatus Limnocylindrales bacterium]